MKKSKLYPAIILSSICIISALLLSVINMFTAPIIKDREEKRALAALSEVLPDGKNFKDLALTDAFPKAVTKAYTADGGYVFRAVGSGRNGDIVVMVGINTEGKIVGTQVISEGESAGYKEKVYTQVIGTDGKYAGQDYETYEPFIAAGATMTSNGFADAVLAALQAYEIANGNAVDTRTPDEILQETCNIALNKTDVTFTRWLATEVLTGVKRVYKCDDGVVFIIGESYIGFNNDGEIVTVAKEDKTTSEPTEEETAVALAAYELYNSSEPTEIAIPQGASSYVLKIYKTATGNYVFDMKAAGNGIKGDSYSHPSGKYIYLSVAISSDGRIIDVITTSRETESKGYGDVCEKDSYTEQFKGAAASDIVITPNHQSSSSSDLGIISGATITSRGYQDALQKAFKAFELLTNEGGNE